MIVCQTHLRQSALALKCVAVMHCSHIVVLILVPALNIDRHHGSSELCEAASEVVCWVASGRSVLSKARLRVLEVSVHTFLPLVLGDFVNLLLPSHRLETVVIV